MASNYFRHWPAKLSARLLRMFMNCWPPFLGAGIKVSTFSADFRLVEVSMKLKWYNKNYVGTHFGGSLFAMADPFYMLMLIRNLGKEYVVWDKAARIDYKKPARGRIQAIFRLSAADIQAIREQADQNEKYIFDRAVDLLNQEGEIVATVIKTLYVKRK